MGKTVVVLSLESTEAARLKRIAKMCDCTIDTVVSVLLAFAVVDIDAAARKTRNRKKK